MIDMISKQVLDLWDRYKPTIAVDAIEYDRELRQLLSTNLASLGTDAISREQACDALEDAEDAFGYLTRDWREVLMELPPIQPEPKRGRWILDRSGAYCCSECMEPCAGYVMMKPRDKFCKMCGSRNEVTE